MKISTVVKTNKSETGYVWIDTCELDNEFANELDLIGLGNDDAVGHPYETMVFVSSKDGEVEEWAGLEHKNYDTEKEANKGHKAMVKKYSTK